MSIGQIWQTITIDSQATFVLGQKIGRNLRGIETISLASDLGGGKTTLVRGIVEGAGSEEHVTSPSFAITNQYKAGDLTIYHYDFYRLKTADLTAEELIEHLNESKAVVLIEWSQIVSNLLPDSTIVIDIKVTSEDHRSITIKYPETLSYLLNEVDQK